MEISNPARVERFWGKVNKDGPYWPDAPESLLDQLKKCWVWIGAKDKDGYPNFTVAKGKTSKGHRFIWTLIYGTIPKDLQVDHKCNNTSCVNYLHLQLLSGYDNNKKSNSASAQNRRKTKCKYNHDFVEDNILKRGNRRICKQCEIRRGRYIE